MRPANARLALAACVAVACTRTPTAAAPAVTRSDASPSGHSPPPTPASAPAINGTLASADGQTILRVWGTPHEMGFAHGALLRDAIIDVVEHYALQVVPPATLAATGTALAKVGDIAPPLREEAQGIIEGMHASGGARIDALDRELVADDLLALNAMTDLVAIGCSSLSTWGDGVAADLNGEPLVVRNLDWTEDADLLEHQIILVTMPSDPARQPIVSVGFAGYIACLSCINEAGVTALFNMGYGDGAGSITTAAAGFAPANLLLRDALERRDIDGDAAASADDVHAALTAARHVGSYIVHLVEPRREGETAPARVLEVESDGVVVRGPEGSLGDQRLAATNHLRAKAAPSSCRRYQKIEQTSHRTARFDAGALWTLGRSLRLGEVVHTVMVEPRTRAVTIWLRAPGERADSTSAGVRHAWADLVAGNSR